MIHQWLRSAIPDSQQPTSPIGFLFLKLPPPPPCAVLLVCIYIYTEQWRIGRLLFERTWAAGFWRVVWTFQHWKQYYKCSHIQNILRNMRLNVSKKRNKIRRSFKKCKRQSTAEPSTAVALCTAMSYILARGIVHLDTNDTKIIGPDNPTC